MLVDVGLLKLQLLLLQDLLGGLDQWHELDGVHGVIEKGVLQQLFRGPPSLYVNLKYQDKFSNTFLQ